MNASQTVYAGWKVSTVPDMLDGDNHFAYIIGYPDGTFRPDTNITRAEAIVLLNRVLCRAPETENDLLSDILEECEAR